MSRPAGVKSPVIGLAFAFATGFLLVILACALYSNWLPLLVVFTYILAPLPNMICARCTGADDVFSDSPSSGLRDAGYFLTSFLVVTGFGLPIALTRSSIVRLSFLFLSFFSHYWLWGFSFRCLRHPFLCPQIHPVAGYMSVAGGILVYGTIVTYTHFFSAREELTI
ncbi:vacuolar protein sorting 55-domain-containing protein [Catenaria anguillulae PL171]|uniref:Vacuolar protein sorting 55-domain-containing protein n=1 Tax=Catenaria anguillulae PL171 TaxID=765915 RepID=A0A1Y2H6H1_9FUNG|nr:vacuolar protein sorting 55-domain-containing protein [Catenaria anguillulae PL171]